MFRRTVAPGIEMRQFEPGDAETVFAVVDRKPGASAAVAAVGGRLALARGYPGSS